MVSRHRGKALSEEQRARWVQLLCKAADDAGLRSTPSGGPHSSRISSGVRGSRSRIPNRKRARPSTCPYRVGGGSATPPPARESRRLRSEHRARMQSPRSFPGRMSQSASPSTSNLSSGREIAGRCASRSISGCTTTCPRTPKRSSIACGPGRCRATEGGPRTESPSSNAGSTRGRQHEARERRSRVGHADNSPIPCQARGCVRERLPGRDENRRGCRRRAADGLVCQGDAGGARPPREAVARRAVDALAS